MDQAEIDAGFELLSELRLRARLHDVQNPDYWRALNPQLTISDQPFTPPQPPISVEPRIVESARLELLEDGYCTTPPLLSADRILPLRLGIERVVGAGFPSPLACGLSGLWAFFVPPGDRAYRRWGALSPHRDSLGPDPHVLARQLPSILNVWTALTDVTPLHSCIYVVPSASDPHYYSENREVHQELVRLQDVRAVPAHAGSIVAWSTHLAHWGSSSSRFARGPRMAIAVYFHRRDAASCAPYSIEFGARAPFEDRLAWIDASLRLQGTMRGV